MDDCCQAPVAACSPRSTRSSSGTRGRSCGVRARFSHAGCASTKERWKNGNRGARNRIHRRRPLCYWCAGILTPWHDWTKSRHGRVPLSVLPGRPCPESRRGNCSSARVPGRPPNRRVAHVLRFSRRGFTDCMRRILYRPPIFHHIQPVTTITDIPLAMLENEDLIGQGRSVSVSRDGLRCRPAAIISAP